MTPLTTPFNRDTTADEVLRGVDLSGRRALITGGSAGVGLETARSLARAGAEVTLAVRDADRGAKAAAEITADTGNPAVHVAALDVADLDSVRAFAESWRGPLHILVNNAGIMALPELQLSRQGWELQFATNHLGHFALANGLHRALSAEGARIVSVSSNAHLYSPVVFDDINFEHRPYDPIAAYCQSKTAMVLFSAGVAQRWAADGITSNALMPGGIRSSLQRHLARTMTAETLRLAESYPWRSAEQGAATSVLVAASPLLDGVSGRYFQDSNEAPVINAAPAQAELEPVGVAAYALDPVAAERLWELSAAAMSAAA